MCQQKKVNTVNLSESDPNENDDCLYIGKTDDDKNDNSGYVLLQINNEIVKFKLDTGAQANLISMKILKLINFRSEFILKNDKILKSYTNDNLGILGKCFLNCRYKENIHKLEFFVVEEDFPCILGLDTSINLNLLKRVDVLNDNTEINNQIYYRKIVNKNLDLFVGLRCLKQQYHIKLNENAIPVVHPPRRIPIPILNKFRETLIDLEKKNIIRKIEEPTDWVNSVVVVRKSNGSLRICLDPADLNRAIKREYFPLPTIDQIILKMTGACIFSTLDANSGFWQVPLDEESSKLCAFSTPYGRYCFLRLPYGIRSAPEVFHKRFKNIFDIEGVDLYVDDIIV